MNSAMLILQLNSVTQQNSHQIYFTFFWMKLIALYNPAKKSTSQSRFEASDHIFITKMILVRQILFEASANKKKPQGLCWHCV